MTGLTATFIDIPLRNVLTKVIQEPLQVLLYKQENDVATEKLQSWVLS